MNAIISPLVFQPPRPVPLSLRKPRPVTVMQSKSGKQVAAYYLRSKIPSEMRTIIYSHGNACDIDQCFDFVKLLNDKLKVNVLHYEYFGYGLLQGEEATEQGVYECAEAAFEFLVKQQKIPEQDIILFGTSLGTAPTIYLASKHPEVRAVVLEAPFTSVVRTKTNFFLAKYFDMFENFTRIDKISGQVLIFHGEDDRVVPVGHGKELFSLCKRQYHSYWVPKAGHNNIREKFGYKQYLQVLYDFFNKAVPKESTCK